MKIETDPKRVRKLARRREDENWRFRSFLKEDVGISGKGLDAIVHKHYAAVRAQIDCSACLNCCQVVLPILSRSDVKRLASGLELSQEELITARLRSADEAGKFTFNKRPCPLLSDDGCTAYESRPSDCRSFPHLHKSGFVFRLIQAVENCSVCPIVFNVFKRSKSELWESRYQL